MNHKPRSDVSALPRRPLRSDFTDRVMRSATRAKRRADTVQRLTQSTKDILSMKPIKFMRTLPGAVVAVAIIATSGVGAYALNNWFGGNVTVSQKDPSVLSVDLSSCKGVNIYGVNSKGDMHAVQFKITGTPHVSADKLRTTLLGACEDGAIRKFYTAQYPEANFDMSKQLSGIPGKDSSLQYLLLSAKVVKISKGTVTLRHSLNKGPASAATKTFTLAPHTTFYEDGKPLSADKLRIGDKVMAALHTDDVPSLEATGFSVFDSPHVQIKSLFKTHYDTDVDKLIDYQKFNVKPMDMIREEQRNKQQQ